MSYEKNQDIIIVLLDIALTIFKGIKKLRGIIKKKAKKIARKDAGLSKAEIDFTNIHLDYDDGRTEYEIDFHKGITEYEYTIDAYTGDILEKSVDSDVD